MPLTTVLSPEIPRFGYDTGTYTVETCAARSRIYTKKKGRNKLTAALFVLDLPVELLRLFDDESCPRVDQAVRIYIIRLSRQHLKPIFLQFCSVGCNSSLDGGEKEWEKKEKKKLPWSI